jgi:hypothetical protein
VALGASRHGLGSRVWGLGFGIFPGLRAVSALGSVIVAVAGASRWFRGIVLRVLGQSQPGSLERHVGFSASRRCGLVTECTSAMAQDSKMRIAPPNCGSRRNVFIGHRSHVF